MKKSLFIPLILIVALLAGCGNTQIAAGSATATAAATAVSETLSASAGSTTAATTTVTTVSSVSDSAATDTTDLFSNRDYEIGYDESESVAIQLSGSTAACDSDAVTIDGGTVTITAEGTYILSGTLADGMIIVDTDKESKVQLVLDGVTICSQTSAAIYVRQADKVFLTLASGSVNTLSNGGEFIDIDENSIDAVIFSKDDLTMNGAGSLIIESPAGHGVVSKDELVITSGTYVITASSHGLSGKDDVCISDGSFTITAGKDGIHAENNDDTELGFVYICGGSFTITAEGDGISASNYLQIEDGSFSIATGGGSANASSTQGYDDWGGKGGMMNMFTAQSATTEDTVSTKGLKADGDILLNGGTFSLDTADDAIHSNSSVYVTDGTYDIAAGDDGLHADEEMNISGGTILISTSYEGIEGMTIDISGGYIMLNASDDGLNAAGGADQSGFGAYTGGMGFSSGSGSLIISGGTLYVNAAGDGLDSNGSLTISGGEIYVNGPTSSMDGSMDCDGEAVITGGVLVAVGASGMAENFSSASTQGAMLVSTGTQAAGSTVQLTDSSGNVLVSWQADKSFECVLISTPDIVQGETYTLTAGSYSTQITMTSLIYGATNGMGGMGNMGGMTGGRGQW